jgi:malate dehydrogenase (oxaloacetate-decarboxylating)(NADP+)
MESGVASRPIPDVDAYHDPLSRFVYQSGTMMAPVFAAAKRTPKRVAYAEGEDERILRAVQVAVEEGLARPVLVGRTDIIAASVLCFHRGGGSGLATNRVGGRKVHDPRKEPAEFCIGLGAETRIAVFAERRRDFRPVLVGEMLLRRRQDDLLLEAHMLPLGLSEALDRLRKPRQGPESAGLVQVNRAA